MRFHFALFPLTEVTLKGQSRSHIFKIACLSRTFQSGFPQGMGNLEKETGHGKS